MTANYDYNNVKFRDELKEKLEKGIKKIDLCKEYGISYYQLQKFIGIGYNSVKDKKIKYDYDDPVFRSKLKLLMDNGYTKGRICKVFKISRYQLNKFLGVKNRKSTEDKPYKKNIIVM